MAYGFSALKARNGCGRQCNHHYCVSLRGIPRLQRLQALSGANLGRCPRLLHSAPLALRGHSYPFQVNAKTLHIPGASDSQVKRTLDYWSIVFDTIVCNDRSGPITPQ
jgi:hypothetical protein